MCRPGSQRSQIILLKVTAEVKECCTLGQGQSHVGQGQTATLSIIVVKVKLPPLVLKWSRSKSCWSYIQTGTKLAPNWHQTGTKIRDVLGFLGTAWCRLVRDVQIKSGVVRGFDDVTKPLDSMRCQTPPNQLKTG